MGNDVVLSAGVRQNLLSLQNTAHLMSITQNRLATGKKVNTALDNPTNFFTSAALNSRASDLGALLDSMSNGIKTLEAADNGVTAITKTIESMQSTLRQARQDKSFKSTSYAISPTATGNLSFSGGSIGATPVDIALTGTSGGTPATAATLTGAGGTDLTAADPDLSALDGETITISDGTNTATYTFTSSATGQKAAMLAALGANGFTVAATSSGLDISRADGQNFTATTSDASIDAVIGLAGGTASTDGVAASGGTTAVKSVDQLVAEINSTLAGQVRASNDNGRLRIENLSTSQLDISGYNNTTGVVDGSVGATSINGNDVRVNFAKQFNGYIDQLNKLADDASFNGVNLLRGDKLKITFNEAGTSTIEIQAKDSSGNPTAINTSTLGILQVMNAEFDSDDQIDARLSILGDALSTLRAQASAFGSNLSIVQNRQDFTKAMINTLQTGADNLVLADSNEEGANMLALQTRQQLSTTALSLSAQADQAVLRLFG